MSGIRLTEQGEGRDLLKKHCRRIGVSVKVVTDLIEIEQEHVGQGRRDGIYRKFDELLDAVVEGGVDVPEADSAA